MQEYEVVKSDVRCDESEIDQYVNVMNGIVAHLMNEGYNQGYRNEIAVNFTVASWMLGFDPEELMQEFVDVDLVDPAMDDDDPSDRVRRIMGYENSFCWDWMIDPGDWVNTAELLVDPPAMFVRKD